MSIENTRDMKRTAVELSEYSRKNYSVELAADIASYALDLPDNPPRADEIASICQNPEQLAILACLARLHVDSLKSIANENIYPPEILSSLSMATQTINNIYRNPDFKKAIEGVDKDHLGREHLFSAEMPRDIFKTAFAASSLYPKNDSDCLIEYGEDLLAHTYDNLPDNHPTKPLIGIEHSLSRLNRGLSADIDFLTENFELLTKHYINKDQHRVATVASWFVALGRDKKDINLELMGMEVFEVIIKKHPEWRSMVPKEIKIRKNKKTRKTIVGLLSLVTIFPPERRKLKEDIVGPIKDDQQT
ncbi:hypothetical protein ACFL0F_01845 [Patescibacteria group bacterium]